MSEYPTVVNDGLFIGEEQKSRGESRQDTDEKASTEEEKERGEETDESVYGSSTEDGVGGERCADADRI